MELIYSILDEDRPIVVLKNNILALVDTGAVIPVWTNDKYVLKNKYTIEESGKKVPVSGFGGITYGELCAIIGFDFDGLIIPKLPIVVLDTLPKDVFSIIIPATLFRGCRYTVDDMNKYFTVEIPGNQNIRNFKVIDSKGHMHVFTSSGIDTFTRGSDIKTASTLIQFVELINSAVNEVHSNMLDNALSSLMNLK